MLNVIGPLPWPALSSRLASRSEPGVGPLGSVGVGRKFHPLSAVVVTTIVGTRRCSRASSCGKKVRRPTGRRLARALFDLSRDANDTGNLPFVRGPRYNG